MLLLGAGVFITAICITGLMVNLSRHFGVVDHPEKRRSHKTVTPRGGGWAIVVPVIIYGLYNTQFNDQWPLLAWLSVMSVVIVGWLDDVFQLSAKIRIIVHIISAFVFINALIPDQSAVVQLLAIMITVWFINLYNFMDGIDLLLAAQLVFVLLCFLFIWPHNSINTGLWVMFFAILGFAVFNFPPAKIFMGDVGSTFIGMMVSGFMFSLGGNENYFMQVYPAILISGVFLVDAGMTLLHRLWQKKSIFQAHNEHCYQYLVQSGWSHLKVVTIYSLINLSFVGSVLWAVQIEHYSALLYLPVGLALIILWWFSRQNAIKRIERQIT